MAGEDEDSDSENAFNKKSVWKRLLIVISGPIMNLVLGFILVVIMVSISGNLYSNVINYSDDISAISQESGLQSGDRIIKVGSTRVHTWSEVSDEVFNKGYKPIDITVIRGGEKIVVKNVVFPTLEESGVLFGQPDFSPSKDDYSYGNILKHSFYRSLSTVRLVVGSFIDLIKGRYGVDAVSGPIGISQTIGAFAQLGAYHFLFIVSLISINLGVFNLFPFPGLDGGRLLFLVIEAILGKPLNRNVEGYIHFVGIIILLGLALTVTFNDILRLFTK
jgi:regulator of sigma E protease